MIALGLCLAAAPALVRAADDQKVRDHEIVEEDYFTIAGVGALAVSPDASVVAYTESRWYEDDDGRHSDLWTVDMEGQTTRLTFDDAGQGSPTWSPDGRFIYYASNRKRAGETEPPFDGKRQVWRMPAGGGEAVPMTRVEGGIASFRLSHDGKAVYYMTSKEHTEDEWKDLRSQFSALDYGHGVHDYHTIWRLSLVTWRTEKLVDEHRYIHSFEVSHDESRIAMHTSPTAELISNEGWSRVDVYDAGKKEVFTVTKDGWRESHASPYGWLDSVAFADDGDAIAFTISFDGYPPRLYIVEFDDEGGFELRELDRPEGVTVGGGTVTWRPGTRDVCFLGESRARTRLYCIPGVRHGGQGAVRTITPGDVVINGFHYAPDGRRVAVINNTLDNAGDIYMVESGDMRRLTNVNPQIDTWKLPQISLVQWTAPDGAEVEGILELPPDYKKEDGPLPMVVEIHGGPTSSTRYRFRLWIYGRALLPAKGYALLSPNYRGSTGYGDKFMVDLVGRENDIEVQDILAGVDAMIERGIADPDHLGVMGWSNGGYLTNCLITKTTRFKAASSGAGVLDQVIQWGTEDTPGHVINFMKGLPWELPDEFSKGSPIYGLGNVTTPTVIHVGENDPRVPPAHARALYRALKHYLDVPTELIVYPGAGHGLTTYQHRLAKMKWDLAWFDKYLHGPTAEPEEPEVADEASDLETH